MSYSSNEVYEVYISIDALVKSLIHATLYKEIEVLGFLLGNFCTWNGKEYTLIKDSQPIGSISKSYMVKPRTGSLARIAKKLGNILNENTIVGWYHSHPGYGCFLSSIDIQSQKVFFTNPNHVALVIDPINKYLDFFKLTNNSYKKASFVIFEKVKENERQK